MHERYCHPDGQSARALLETHLLSAPFVHDAPKPPWAITTHALLVHVGRPAGSSHANACSN